MDLPVALLSALVFESPLGMALVAPDGRFLAVNQALAAINGLPVEAHIGRHLRDVVPDVWREAEPVFERALRGEVVEQVLSGETPREPGAVRYWSEQWFPVRDEAGAVVAAGATVVEITEQRRAERALAETAESLEDLVRLASHELKGPLSIIMGFAQRLTRRPGLPSDVAEAAGFIHQQSVEMRHRLEMFLTVTELGGAPERLTVDLEPTSLGELVREEVASMRVRHPDADVEVDARSDIELHTSPPRLRQVLANLLDNAAKYGGDGRIAVRLIPGEDGCVIEVRDEGPGIPRDQQQRIFERRYRAPAHRNTVSGDGLGLYVADQVTRLIGGSLSLRSAPGEGTSFFIHLPAEPEPPAERTAAGQ